MATAHHNAPTCLAAKRWWRVDHASHPARTFDHSLQRVADWSTERAAGCRRLPVWTRIGGAIHPCPVLTFVTGVAHTGAMEQCFGRQTAWNARGSIHVWESTLQREWLHV